MNTSTHHRRSLLLLAFLCLLLCSAGIQKATAQTLRVTSKVSPKTVTPGEQLTYTITLSSQGSALNRNNLKVPRIGTLRRLILLSQTPSLSSSNSYINGALSSSLSLNWTLRAATVGAGVIPDMTITYGSKAYTIKSTQVIVKAPQALTLPGGVLAAKTRSASENQRLLGKLFARLVISNPTPHLQETFTVKCLLYLDPSLLNTIKNPGWQPPVDWAKHGIIAKAQQIGQAVASPVQYGGRKYMAAEIGVLHLTPTRAGEFSIPLHAAQCLLLDSSRSMSNFGLLSSNYLEVQLPVAAQTIDVKPLPTQGRPPSFAGAVGQFTFAAGVDTTEASEDAFVTLKCKVAGTGYAGSINAPKLPELTDWNQRETEVKNATPKDAAIDFSAKSFEYVLTPKKHGVLTIPAIAYAFFDPKQKRYVEVTSNPIKVNVAKGTKPTESIIVFDNPLQGDGTISQVVADTLVYIHTDTPVYAASIPVFARSFFWPLQATPLLLLLAAMGWRIRRGYLERNRDNLRVKAAGGRARRELKTALTSLNKQDFDPFHAQLAEALRAYVATKLQRPTAGLTLDEITHDCQERGATEEQALELRAILEQCDMARFCSGATDAKAEVLYQTAAALLPELDKVFK